MIIQSVHVAVGSLLFTSLFADPKIEDPVPALECAEFEASAHELDSVWEARDVRAEALALLAMYPGSGCAPAARVVLAKRAIDASDPSGPLARILLLQGVREERRGAVTLVDLIAQIELLEHLERRGRVLLRCGQFGSGLAALSRRADAWIGREPDAAVLSQLFALYRMVAEGVLIRDGGRPIRRR